MDRSSDKSFVDCVRETRLGPQSRPFCLGAQRLYHSIAQLLRGTLSLFDSWQTFKWFAYTSTVPCFGFFPPSFAPVQLISTGFLSVDQA